MKKVTDRGRYLYVKCDCGEQAHGRERMVKEQNSDYWVICKACGKKESLAVILGMV